MSKTQRRWSPQEDSILQKEVEAQIAGQSTNTSSQSEGLGADGSHRLSVVATHGVARDWNSIAQKIKGRSNKDCRKRFYNGITEGLKKGPWTTGEDQTLEKLVNKYGPAWAVIAQEIETRSADQCSKRWQHCLDPELDRSSWSTEENIALMIAVRTHESAWKDIQMLHFSSRSANNVKNQSGSPMYSVLKRKSLEVPQDAPSCCSTRAESRRDDSQNEANISHISNDNSILSGPFDIEMDPTFDGLTGNDLQYPEVDQSFAHALSETDDLFQRPDMEMQPHAMMPESIDQNLGPWLPPGGSAMEIAGSQTPSSRPMTVDLNHDPFGFHRQDAIPNSISYRQTQPSQRNNPRHNSVTDGSQDSQMRGPFSGSAFEWSNASDPVLVQHQQQSPSSVSANISSPATPTLQTTIRLEGADPSTLSAVMGALIESRARFRFETH